MHGQLTWWSEGRDRHTQPLQDSCLSSPPAWGPMSLVPPPPPHGIQTPWNTCPENEDEDYQVKMKQIITYRLKWGRLLFSPSHTSTHIQHNTFTLSLQSTYTYTFIIDLEPILYSDILSFPPSFLYSLTLKHYPLSFLQYYFTHYLIHSLTNTFIPFSIIHSFHHFHNTIFFPLLFISIVTPFLM